MRVSLTRFLVVVGLSFALSSALRGQDPVVNYVASDLELTAIEDFATEATQTAIVAPHDQKDIAPPGLRSIAVQRTSQYSPPEAAKRQPARTLDRSKQPVPTITSMVTQSTFGTANTTAMVSPQFVAHQVTEDPIGTDLFGAIQPVSLYSNSIVAPTPLSMGDSSAYLPMTFGPSCGLPTATEEFCVARGIPAHHGREVCEDCTVGLSTCCTTTCCSPCWRVRVDALFLDRVGGGDDRLAECACADGLHFADANGFDPYIHAGPRFRLYRDVGPCCGPSYDAEYFMINQWSRVRNFAGDLTLLGTPIGDGTATVRYDSRLQSAQLNASLPLGNWMRHFVGFRWISLDEDATISGSGTLVPNFLQMATTNNDLYGGHYGLQRNIWDHGGCFSVDVIGRAGLFYNSIHRDTVGFGTASLSDSTTSFVGDLALEGHYDLNDCWRLEVGYQLIWITNVALAIDQFTSPTVIDDTGDLFLHGAYVGLSHTF